MLGESLCILNNNNIMISITCSTRFSTILILKINMLVAWVVISFISVRYYKFIFRIILSNDKNVEILQLNQWLGSDCSGWLAIGSAHN